MLLDPARTQTAASPYLCSGASHSWLLSFLLMAVVNIAFVSWWSLTSDQIAGESGPIENFQLAVLAISLVVFLRTGLGQTNAERHFFIAAAIACLYLFLRELDLRTLPVSGWILWLGGDIPRKVIQGLVATVLVLFVLRNFRAIFDMVRSGGVRQAWPYATTFLLFCAAKMAEEISRADKNKFGDFALPHGQLWEEMLELNAHMMMLAVAVISYRLGRKLLVPCPAKHSS